MSILPNCSTSDSSAPRESIRRPHMLADIADRLEAERAIHTQPLLRCVQDRHAITGGTRVAHRASRDRGADADAAVFWHGRDIVDASDAGAEEQRARRDRPLVHSREVMAERRITVEADRDVLV